MTSSRLWLALLWASVPAWSAPLVRVDIPVRSSPISPIALPAVLPNTFSAPSLPLGLRAAPPSLSVPSAPNAVPLPAAVPAAPAFKAVPAASEGPASAAPAPAPAAPDREFVELTMPDGRAISVSRGFMDEKRAVTVFDSGPDGVLLDLGPSETSVGLRAGALFKVPTDWAFFSHDGRVTAVQEGRAPDRLVGGAARSVLVLASGRARTLGLKPGAVVPRLGEGSTVLEVRDALMSGDWEPFDYAEAMKENPAPEPRHFLDSLVAVFDGMIREGGPDAARAADLRWEVIKAVAKHPTTDGHLRMQAATLMWKDGMPRTLFRLNADLPLKWQVAYQWSDTWVHETGHQLAAKLVGSPLMEKRVHAHGAGFITTPTNTAPRQLLIDAAGGAAETAVGSSAAALGVWALLGLHGWALAALALPASALVLLGLHMAYSSVAHAANDLQHMFGLLGWEKARAFMEEAIAESSRDGLKAKRPGLTVPVSIFYRALLRRLARALFRRG